MDGKQGIGQEPASDWGTRLRRTRTRPPGRYVVLSVFLHAAAVAAFWVAGMTFRPSVPEFEQFRISMISPPPTEAAPAPEPVETSTPVQVEPEPTPPPPEPKPQPKPAPEPPKTQAATPKPVERKPEPARGPDPKPAPVGGENLNIQQEGREFLFPEYQENIIRVLNSFFRWTGSPDLEAEVSFTIMRDGSVRDIQLVRKSGNFGFDLQARGAVESAGRARAFGPLPDAWHGDRLQVLYTYQGTR